MSWELGAGDTLHRFMLAQISWQPAKHIPNNALVCALLFIMSICLVRNVRLAYSAKSFLSSSSISI